MIKNQSNALHKKKMIIDSKRYQVNKNLEKIVQNNYLDYSQNGFNKDNSKSKI